jgi:hypothetical protein
VMNRRELLAAFTILLALSVTAWPEGHDNANVLTDNDGNALVDQNGNLLTE